MAFYPGHNHVKSEFSGKFIDTASIIMDAGILIGLLLKYSSDEWATAAHNPALLPEHAEIIMALADIRMSLDGGAGDAGEK